MKERGRWTEFSGRGKVIRHKCPCVKHSIQNPGLSRDTAGQVTSQGLVSPQVEWTGLTVRFARSLPTLAFYWFLNPRLQLVQSKNSSAPDSTKRSFHPLMGHLSWKLTCHLLRDASVSPNPLLCLVVSVALPTTLCFAHVWCLLA